MIQVEDDYDVAVSSRRNSRKAKVKEGRRKKVTGPRGVRSGTCSDSTNGALARLDWNKPTSHFMSLSIMPANQVLEVMALPKSGEVCRVTTMKFPIVPNRSSSQLTASRVDF
jgi:hypothetical protein